MRVHCFSTGQVRLKRGERGIRRYFSDDWRDETLPVNVFVVEHPDGICMFDAGQTAWAASPGYFPWWYPFFHLARFELRADEEAVCQLREVGLRPTDVRWLVVSHMHTDHVGGVEPFRSAEVIVSAVEWRRAVGLGGRLRGYLPQYWPNGLVPRLVEFEAPADELPLPSVDLAGDGSLLLIPTPGHTPGHISLLVRDEHESFLLCGDVVHSPSELTVAAPRLAELCANERATVLTTHHPYAGEIVKIEAR